DPRVSTPSISDFCRPASSSALIAGMAWNCIGLRSGTRPTGVSPIPTIATCLLNPAILTASQCLYDPTVDDNARARDVACAWRGDEDDDITNLSAGCPTPVFEDDILAPALFLFRDFRRIAARGLADHLLE